ncbi:MAG: T9SS type A sorting domain-containing protein [Bacteroidia bacterium]
MKTKFLFIAVILIIFISEIAEAQITFQKTYGRTTSDISTFVRQTTDGGYIFVGNTIAFGGGNYDIYFIKTDVNGDTLWTKIFGGVDNDMGNCLQQTSDGGYIITGMSYSFGAGNGDIYLIKTDANGDILWAKTYGGINNDEGNSVQQTIDGGYIITGNSASSGAGSPDVYLIKTDTNGDTLWIKTFSGTGANNEYGRSVCQTTDGGYFIVGYTTSFGAGAEDVYLIKTDANGDTLWTKTLGGTNTDIALSGCQTNDGGYIVTGYTNSFGAGSFDIYLIKTDVNGDTLWTKCYGGSGDDYVNSVQQTNDGGYIIAGRTTSFGGNIEGYLIKTNGNGDTLWTKSFGYLGGNDYVRCVQQTNDGGYIIAGYTASFGSGYVDVYLIKTDSLGNSGCNESSTATIVSTTATQVTTPTTIVTSLPTIVTTPATLVGSGGTFTTLCTSVGIAPNSNFQLPISFSPNPFHSSTTLTLNDAFSFKDLTLSIFSMEGRMIRTFPVSANETVIERNELAAGIYFYKLTNKEAVKGIGKLVIQ